MKYAVSEGERIEAKPRAKGVCPSCGSEMVAKCGGQKVWHWAHRGRKHCDHWWENETEWHRDWKNHFSDEWQEIGARDAAGELHIADIKAPHGLVVEFQHSFLKREEALKRTQFYGNMFWVVDGLRRNTDLAQFKEALEFARTYSTPTGVIYQIPIRGTRLLREWAPVGVFVAFDFGINDVWLLRRVHDTVVFGFFFPKADLIEAIKSGKGFPDIVYNQNYRRGVRRYRRW